MVAPVRISDHVPAAPDKQLDEVVIYDDGLVNNLGSAPLSIPLSKLVDVEIFFYTINGTQSASRRLPASELLELINNPTVTGYMVYDYTAPGTATGESRGGLKLDSCSDTTLVPFVSTTYTPANEGIYKVIGYRKRYAPENNSRTISVNGGNNVIVNAEYEVKLPSDFIDPTTGLVREGLSVRAQIYNDGANGGRIGWGETGWIYATGSGAYGCKAGVVEASVFVQTGGYALMAAAGSNGGHQFGALTDNIFSAPCQVIATLNDKTAISVPVADKGYGGLRKDTVDTVALADFTVPNVIDFNLELVSPPLKVTQNVTNNRLSLSQIGIWGSSGSINLTFDSGNNGREIIADIYNETKGQVALEKPEYVARNQLGITIPISVDVLEILTSGDEYSLRVRSNDVFTNVKVGKCWWDVTLNAPL